MEGWSGLVDAPGLPAQAAGPFNTGVFSQFVSCLDSPGAAAVFIERGRAVPAGPAKPHSPTLLARPDKDASHTLERGQGGRQSKPQPDPKLSNSLQIANSSSHLPSSTTGLLLPFPFNPLGGPVEDAQPLLHPPRPAPGPACSIPGKGLTMGWERLHRAPPARNEAITSSPQGLILINSSSKQLQCWGKQVVYIQREQQPHRCMKAS